MPSGAPGCQRNSTPPRPLAPGDRSTPGIRGSRPKALLTQPGAALSSSGQECHVLKHLSLGRTSPAARASVPELRLVQLCVKWRGRVL